MISGRNALFLMITLDGIIRSYMSVTSLFSVIAFGSCFQEFFWNWDIKVFADMPMDYSTFVITFVKAAVSAYGFQSALKGTG